MIWLVPEWVDRDAVGRRLLEVEVWASAMDDTFGTCGSMFTWRAVRGAYGFSDGGGRVFVSCAYGDCGDRVCFYLLGELDVVVSLLSDWVGPAPELSYSGLCGGVGKCYGGACLPFNVGEFLGLWLGGGVLWSWRGGVGSSDGSQRCCVSAAEDWVLGVLECLIEDFTWKRVGSDVLYDSRWLCPAVVESFCSVVNKYYTSFLGSMIQSFMGLDAGVGTDVVHRVSGGVLAEFRWGIWSGCMRSVLGCSALWGVFDLSEDAYLASAPKSNCWKIDVCWDSALGFTGSGELLDHVLNVSSLYLSEGRVVS